MEEWKDIKGFEGRFRISNYGHVISINGKFKGEKMMKTSIDTTGYNQVVLNGCGKRLYTRVHVLVAEHFIDGKTIERCQVNHKDGIKTNNHYSNLEWVSLAENIRHSLTYLHDQKGINSSSAKLSEFQVMEIRRLRAMGYTRKKIKETLSLPINERHISDIYLRVCWKHI